MKSSILVAVCGFAAAASCATVVRSRQAPVNYDVTLNDIIHQGFLPSHLFNVKPGDTVTFHTKPDSDHQIVAAVPQDFCVPIAGGLDSGIRLAGTASTYVYSVPNPFPFPAVEFFDQALLDERGECTQFAIYNGSTIPPGT